MKYAKVTLVHDFDLEELVRQDSRFLDDVCLQECRPAQHDPACTLFCPRITALLYSATVKPKIAPTNAPDAILLVYLSPLARHQPVLAPGRI